MKLKSTKIRKVLNGEKLKIAIVLPYFNEKIGLKLLEKAKIELKRNKVKSTNIKVYRVSGALEIPFATKKIIEKQTPDAIIALGVIIRGETSHYDLVTSKTFDGLMKIQLEKDVPIVFGILTTENVSQALSRIEKGTEVAYAALIQTTYK